MPEVATKRKAAAAKEEPKKAGRGRPPKAEVAEKPSPAKKTPAAAPVSDDEPKAKRGRGRPPKNGLKAQPKKQKYPGKGRGRPKASDVPAPQSEEEEEEEDDE